MKLTKSHREETLEKIIADVPQENFLAQIEIFIEKEVAKLRKTNGVPQELLHLDIVKEFTISRHIYCSREHERTYNFSGRLSLHRNVALGLNNWNNAFYFKKMGITHAQAEVLSQHDQITELLEKHIEQRNRIEDLRDRIMPILKACSTLKQALELLPEFEKYFPAEVVKVDRTLPVVGNLVSDLMKQGWPAKTKKKTTKKE